MTGGPLRPVTRRRDGSRTALTLIVKETSDGKSNRSRRVIFQGGNPEALYAWYEKHLGIKRGPEGAVAVHLA